MLAASSAARRRAALERRGERVAVEATVERLAPRDLEPHPRLLRGVAVLVEEVGMRRAEGGRKAGQALAECAREGP
eukprot:2937140-Prymnesium_polylepis.1